MLLGLKSKIDICDWRFSEAGMRQLEFATAVEASHQVFKRRPDVAIEDNTPWEFALALREQGWVWQPWLPPSSRTTKTQLACFIPEGYVVGDKKICSSTCSGTSKLYLLCLLRAEELKSQGCSMIPHGAPEAYPRILAGKCRLGEGQEAQASFDG